MKFKDQLKAGVILDNPIFMQTIGLCPTLATSTSLSNAIGMGVAATVVLICSNVVISALRRFIPDKVRIAAFITIIAAFVTTIDLALQAFVPSLAASLGLFLPLIVVNCIILGRAEAYASKNKVLPSALDGVCMGLGFTFALVLMGFFRELLGAGTVLSGLSTLLPFLAGVIPAEGFAIPFFNANPMVMMILPAGGFLMLGFIFAAIQKIMAGKEDK
ncbi:MAG TPA: electron transport complex subunit RsxE [Candidatus Agathobaculum merdigallinarum]|nr:electron transport complex subunit RsxE [Candidatus Agathobaculum merdigallinarum]